MRLDHFDAIVTAARAHAARLESVSRDPHTRRFKRDYAVDCREAAELLRDAILSLVEAQSVGGERPNG